MSLTVGEKNELLSFLVFFYRNHCYFNIGMLCSGSKHLYEKLIIFVGVFNFHQKFLCVPAQSTSDFHYHLIQTTSKCMQVFLQPCALFEHLGSLCGFHTCDTRTEGIFLLLMDIWGSSALPCLLAFLEKRFQYTCNNLSLFHRCDHLQGQCRNLMLNHSGVSNQSHQH